jgi:vacuolar-type H+-ATPase subunit I/STV1
MTARKPTQTIVVDFRIPFWRMVAIMVKLSIASIPAAIILAVIYFAATVVISGLFAGGVVLS